MTQNTAKTALITGITGQYLSISELAQFMREITGFSGEIRFDAAKPDGTPRNLLDVSRLQALGWRHEVVLREGIESSYEMYRSPGERTKKHHEL